VCASPTERRAAGLHASQLGLGVEIAGRPWVYMPRPTGSATRVVGRPGADPGRSSTRHVEKRKWTPAGEHGIGELYAGIEAGGRDGVGLGSGPGDLDARARHTDGTDPTLTKSGGLEGR
jgi:hypothetical protein